MLDHIAREGVPPIGAVQGQPENRVVPLVSHKWFSHVRISQVRPVLGAIAHGVEVKPGTAPDYHDAGNDFRIDRVWQ